MAKKPNPVIEKARQDGYDKGFSKGTKFGFDQGKYSACMFFAEKMDGIEKAKGIGPKTMKIIVEHFGRDFFQQVDEKK